MSNPTDEIKFNIPQAWLEVSELKEGSPVNIVAGKCPGCGAVFYPFHDTCIRCGSPECTPTVLSTTGVVYSQTVVHQAPKEFAVPYRAAYVLFSEGPLIFGQITGMQDVEIGDQVEAALGRLRDKEGGSGPWTFMFRPISGGMERGE